MQPRKRPPLALSAAASTLQMLIVSTTGLLIYGYMIRTLGAETVGGWLAVMALGMIACIADFGLREALVRRTAAAATSGTGNTVRETIDTHILTVATSLALALILALGSWPWSEAALGHQAGQLATHGIPIGIIVWLQRVADMHSAGLEGLQRFDLTARNNTLAAVIGLSAAFTLIPQFGLRGTEAALIAQYGSLLLLNRITLHHELGSGPAWVWRWPILKPSLAYGFSVQGTVASVLLVESLAKLLLGRMGEPALLSYFDFAFRLTRGIRGFLVAGNRVLVPRIAEAKASGQDHGGYYRVSFTLLAALSIPVFSVLAGSSGLISILLTGSWIASCVNTLILLSVAWLAFCLMDPAFNMQLGTARMNGPLLGHLLMPILTLALATPLANHFGGEGVILAVTLAIVIGCVVVVTGHHLHENLSPQEIRPAPTLILLLSGAIAAWAGITLGIACTEAHYPLWLSGTASIAIASLLTAPPALYLLRETPMARFIPGHNASRT